MKRIWPRSFGALGVVLAGLAGWDFVALGRTIGRLEADQPLLARRAALAGQLEREDDPTAAVLRWARAGVDDAFDLRWLAALSPAEAEVAAAEVSARLLEVEERAGAIASRRPWRGDAWLALGSAQFLRNWREDPQALRTDGAWRVALDRAIARSGSDTTAERFVAIAALERWSELDASEQDASRAVVARALADPVAFPVVLPGWLALHLRGNLDEALAAIPDRSGAWEAVAQWWLARGRSGRALEAWARRDAARLREAQEALERANRMLEGGAVRRARGELGPVLALAPSRAAVGLFVDASRRLPGAAPDVALAPALEAWLEWSTELAVHGRPALPADVLHRVGAAVDPTVGAAAMALSGDIEGARALARRGDPYRAGPERVERLGLALATSLVAAGRRTEALEALAGLPLERREAPEGRRLLARARGETVVETPAAAVLRREWRSRRGRVLLDLVAPLDAVLQLEVEASPGSIAEVSVDGNVSRHAIEGRRTLALALPVEGGPVLVTLQALRGRVVPGDGVVVVREP